MKQFIIWLLALGMCSINLSAQTKKHTPIRKTNPSKTSTVTITKERKVGNDGYVWYKLKRGNKYGARDIEGKNIIPIKYDFLEYYCFAGNRGTHYFYVKEGDFAGTYTRQGTLVVSPNRHYVSVSLEGYKGNICWTAKRNGGSQIIVLDAKGNEAFSLSGLTDVSWSEFETVNSFRTPELPNAFFFRTMTGNHLDYKEQKYGVCDLNGNILCSPQINSIGIRLSDDRKTIIGAYNGKDIIVPINYYDGITMFDYTPYEDLYYSFTESSSSSSSPSSSSSDSSPSSKISSSSSIGSNNNSESKTTTIVVEHQHSPQPMTEWFPCGACGHNPGVCQTCVGNRTNFRGDPCISCRGTGKCHFCNGNGGRYQTVYR